MEGTEGLFDKGTCRLSLKGEWAVVEGTRGRAFLVEGTAWAKPESEGGEAGGSVCWRGMGEPGVGARVRSAEPCGPLKEGEPDPEGDGKPLEALEQVGNMCFSELLP